MKYTCPMHPEIESPMAGTCPKCGMALVLKNETKEVKIHKPVEDKGLGVLTGRSYIPLIVIIGLILLATLTLGFRDSSLGIFSPEKTITYFMTGFFLVFAGFKLMDLKGFAEGYSTYDLLAMKLPAYGYVYPFIELAFGLIMLAGYHLDWLLWTEFIIMAFSGLGVAIKLAKREEFQCACLGTFLKVPLTKVTLAEDFGMALLALVMLIMQ